MIGLGLISQQSLLRNLDVTPREARTLIQEEHNWAVENKSDSSRSEANRGKTRLKFHGVAVFVRSLEAEIYSKIATRQTIDDIRIVSCFGLFSGVFLLKKVHLMRWFTFALNRVTELTRGNEIIPRRSAFALNVLAVLCRAQRARTDLIRFCSKLVSFISVWPRDNESTHQMSQFWSKPYTSA